MMKVIGDTRETSQCGSQRRHSNGNVGGIINQFNENFDCPPQRFKGLSHGESYSYIMFYQETLCKFASASA